MAAVYFGGAVVSEASLTKSWGINPGGGNLTLPGDAGAGVGQDVSITLGGTNFSGVVADYRVETSFTSGKQTHVQFADNRVKLHWDDVYCAFNMIEVRPDDPYSPGIARQKRYWHITPDDWDAQRISWSNEPWSAQDIIEMILGADTVNYSWTAVFHEAQTAPVYGIDANNGAKLANVLQEIADHQGLVVTLTGPYELTWARKGEGQLPIIPSYAETSELGEALAPNDTCIRVIGDSNRYQEVQIDLEPDWVTAWEGFVFEPLWQKEVAALFGLSANSISDLAELSAKMRSVTVREYSNAKGGGFEDWGMWGEVGRMDIPAWTYLQEIVFKAYRVPYSFTLNGIELYSLTLVEGLLANVLWDSSSGIISYLDPPEYYPDAKAFVIAQGQPIDVIDPRNQSPMELNGSAWNCCNRFCLDTKNKVVIFEAPVIKPGDGDKALYLFPNRAISGVAQNDALYNLAVPNAKAQFSAAPVRASLCFDAERFSKRYGSGVRKSPRYTRGLCYHALMVQGAFSQEVKYSDDKSADDKSDQLAGSLIHQHHTYPSGSFKRPGAAGTELNGCIDRVTVSLNFHEGLTEKVTFAKESAPVNYDNERHLDRRQRARDLFPGQQHLLEDVKRLRWQARTTKGLTRNSPTDFSTLSDVFQTPLGNVDCSPVVITDPSGAEWRAGQPVLLDSAGTPSKDGEAFGGVVIADGSAGSFTVATQGNVFLLCQGPVSANDSIGIDPGEGQTAKVGGEIPLGTAKTAYSGTDTALLVVRLGAGAAADSVPTPFAVMEGSQTGTLRINYNSKLFVALRHPNGDPNAVPPIPKPLQTIAGLSTPDPGLVENGVWHATPGYVDPGDFTPGLGPIWLTYWMDVVTEPPDAAAPPQAYIDYIKDNNGTPGLPWDGFPDLAKLIYKNTDGAIIGYAQEAAYRVIADVVEVDSPEPGQIFTLGTGENARQVKVVQSTFGHLLLTDINYDAVMIKAMVPF